MEFGLSGQPDRTWAAARDAAITSFMKSMPDQSPQAATGRSSDSILLASAGGLSPPVAPRALHAVGKYYPARRGESSPLTALSNVVAYPCHKVEQ
jgi:hypothetical protein